MKRLTATSAIALLVLGCGFSDADVQLGEPVTLLTGPSGCYLTWAQGPLIADPEFGTAIRNTSGQGVQLPDPVRISPVMWPTGFTGRRAGSEVAVLDPDGRVIAVTGRTYKLDGGWGPSAIGAFMACGYGGSSR